MSQAETSSPTETEALGADLAAELRPGDVVLIEGDLGAGKTTLVRGACRALGVAGPITSPTFTIGQRYPGRVSVAHIDLFRIADLDDEDPDLLADYVGPEMITFIEWPKAAEITIEGARTVAARVRIEHLGGDRRAVQISRGPGTSRGRG
jgi:tRNA threonylcarbamoyladenosine biosynthesis protein TsaE